MTRASRNIAKHASKWAGVAVVVLAVALAARYLPLGEWFDVVEDWVEATGDAGVAAFSAAYAVASLLMFPAGLMTIAAGALFGFAWGFIAVTAASTVGAIAAFMIARHLLKERVTGYFRRNGRLDAMDKALRKEGWRAVALLRLSPLVPFTVKSYLFGVSRVRFRDYVIGTIVGKLPGSVVLTALGASGRTALGTAGPLKWVMLALGIGATVLATWLIGRAATRRLAAT